MSNDYNITIVKLHNNKENNITTIDWELTFPPLTRRQTNPIVKTGNSVLPNNKVITSSDINKTVLQHLIESGKLAKIKDEVLSDQKERLLNELMPDGTDLNTVNSNIKRKTRVMVREEWTGELELYDELLIWKLTFKKGCKRTDSWPTPDLDFYDQVSEGDWVKKPDFTFLKSGSVIFERLDGTAYRSDSTVQSRYWHPAITYTWTALEDNSTVVCIGNYKKDPLVQYDHRRELLSPGEQLFLEPVKTYIYVCEGELVLSNGLQLREGDIFKVNEPQVTTLVAVTPANIIVANNEQEYKFEKTAIAPDYVKHTRIK